MTFFANKELISTAIYKNSVKIICPLRIHKLIQFLKFYFTQVDLILFSRLMYYLQIEKNVKFKIKEGNLIHIYLRLYSITANWYLLNEQDYLPRLTTAGRPNLHVM